MIFVLSGQRYRLRISGADIHSHPFSCRNCKTSPVAQESIHSHPCRNHPGDYSLLKLPTRDGVPPIAKATIGLLLLKAVVAILGNSAQRFTTLYFPLSSRGSRTVWRDLNMRTRAVACVFPAFLKQALKSDREPESQDR